MNTQSFVAQRSCLRYAALAFQVSVGLDSVIKDGVLPPYYRGVFLSAAMLCDEIVESAYYNANESENPHGRQIGEISQATIWFSSLTKGYPKIYEDFETYEDVYEIGDTLEYLARDDSSPRAYSDDRIRTIKAFFLSIWGAVEQECMKDGIPLNIDFGAFYEDNLYLQ